MDLPETRKLLRRLEVVESTGSTNADLVRAASAEPAAWPAPSAIATDHQTAGRGRLGRAWQAAKGDSLAVSVLLRPGVAPERLGWVALAAGAAMTSSLRDLGVDAVAKWPNDVLIGGRKVCGILGEAMPGGAVVVGAGLNHAAPEGALPVPFSTSLAVEGGATDPDLLISGFLARLLGLVADLGAQGGADSVRAAVLAVPGTVGRRVRVSLPDGRTVTGEAVDLDPEGRIVVDTGAIVGSTAIAAGDVEHLRYE